MAVSLVAASIVLLCVESVLLYTDWESADPLFDALIVGFVVAWIGGFALLAYKVWVQRQWAHRVLVALLAISFTSQQIMLAFMPPTLWNEWVSHVGYGVLDAVALGLLLSRASRAWVYGPREDELST